MDDLIKNILAEYNDEEKATAATLRTRTPGGIWLSQAPQTITGTYIILTAVSSIVDYAMGTGIATVDAQIQFMICSPNNALETVEAKTALRTLFTDNLLTNVIYARPVNAGELMRDPDSDGYMNLIVYRYIVKQ